MFRGAVSLGTKNDFGFLFVAYCSLFPEVWERSLMVECWSPKPAAKVRFLPLLQRVADSDLPVMCFWPHRLSVRTSGSHPEKRGSIPLEATTGDFFSDKSLVYLKDELQTGGSKSFILRIRYSLREKPVFGTRNDL